MSMEKKREQGFDSRYNPKLYDTIAGTLAGLGYTHVQMAKMLGICRTTFDKWRKDNPSFNQAIADGKHDADEVVVQSLYQRACGYSHIDTHITAFKGKIIKTEYVKHYPPDATSMIFWLKNRDRANWREKQEITHAIEDGDFIKETPAEVAAKMDSLTSPLPEILPDVVQELAQRKEE